MLKKLIQKQKNLNQNIIEKLNAEIKKQPAKHALKSVNYKWKS